MDVYGYNRFPSNRPEDLANQLYAQQAISSAQYREPHVMPMPSGNPWNASVIPWVTTAPSQLVQFTAQMPTSSPIVHCKRKSLDPEPFIPAKQHITEEKIAAHLNGLHLSADYTNYSMGAVEEMDLTTEGQTSDIYEKLKGHKIIIAEEVKRIKEEPILPPSIIEKLEKPCMSLVVWQPKESILDPKPKDRKQGEVIEEGRKRNGVLVPEHTSIMDVEM